MHNSPELLLIFLYLLLHRSAIYSRVFLPSPFAHIQRFLSVWRELLCNTSPGYFFFFQVNSTEATHAAKPHVQMVKPFEPWLVGDDAKLAVCSWQPLKITTSEENLINTLLNIMEGKICNSRRNSGHTRLQRRKKKSLSNSLFPFCCIKWGGRAGSRVLQTSPMHPYFPRDQTRGTACTHTAQCLPIPALPSRRCCS